MLEIDMKPDEMELLHNVLLEAYPTRADLERMLFYELGWRLNEIAGPGGMRATTFELLTHAEAMGEEWNLLRAAYRRNPGNPRLADAHRSLLGGDSVPAPVAHEPAPPAARVDALWSVAIHHAPCDNAYCEALEQHLNALVKAGVVRPPWSVAQITPGAHRRSDVERRFQAADAIVVLVSAELLAESEEILDQIHGRHRSGAAVLPVLLRPVMWESWWLSELRACPMRGGEVTPVSRWSDKAAAWVNVVEALSRLLRDRRRAC